MLSIREARFTVSPTTVYDREDDEPMVPTTASPVAMPMRISRVGGLRRIPVISGSCARSATIASCWASAARQASLAWSSPGREGRRPERHDGVADIFVDDAIMGVDHGGDRAEVAV